MGEPTMLATGEAEFRALAWRSVETLPHYVYRVFREDGVLLYVGKSHEVWKRLARHSRSEWRPYAATVRWELWPDHAAAAAREADVIAAEFPLHNTQTYGADIGAPMSPKRVAGERAFRGVADPLGDVTPVGLSRPLIRRRTGPGPATLIMHARLEEEERQAALNPPPMPVSGRRADDSCEGETF